MLTVEPNDHGSLVTSFRFLTGADPVCVPRTETPPEQRTTYPSNAR